MARTKDSRAYKAFVELLKKATERAFRRNGLIVLLSHFTAKISVCFTRERTQPIKDEVYLLKKLCLKNKKMVKQVFEQLTESLIEILTVSSGSFFNDDIEFLHYIIVSVMVILVTVPALNAMIIPSIIEKLNIPKLLANAENVIRVTRHPLAFLS